MQLLGRDRIHRTFTEGTTTLHELCSGNYQLGSGEDAAIVESIDQIEKFPEVIKQDVKAWLEKGGVNRARIEKRELVMAEQAANRPGTVDALLNEIGDPALTGQIVEMLRELVKKAQAPKPVLAEVDGGVLVAGEGGTKEFIPDDAQLDDVMKRELELDAKDPDRQLVAVGGGEGEDDSLGAQIGETTRATTRAAQSKAGKGKAKTR